jgi:hypothetical protein
MELQREDFLPELINGHLKRRSFQGSHKSGCKIYIVDLNGVTQEQLEQALAAEHRLNLRHQSVQMYGVMDQVTSIVFQLKSEFQPGDLWLLLQETLQLNAEAALVAIRIYRLKYVDTRKKAPLVNVYWQHCRSVHLQERPLALSTDGRVVASPLLEQQQSFGINEPMLDFMPAAAEHSAGLTVAAAAAAVDVGSGSNSSNGNLNSSSSFSFVPAAPALSTTGQNASDTSAASNSAPASILSVPGIGPLPQYVSFITCKLIQTSYAIDTACASHVAAC